MSKHGEQIIAHTPYIEHRVFRYSLPISESAIFNTLQGHIGPNNETLFKFEVRAKNYYGFAFIMQYKARIMYGNIHRL